MALQGNEAGALYGQEDNPQYGAPGALYGQEDNPQDGAPGALYGEEDNPQYGAPGASYAQEDNSQHGAPGASYAQEDNPQYAAQSDRNVPQSGNSTAKETGRAASQRGLRPTILVLSVVVIVVVAATLALITFPEILGKSRDDESESNGAGAEQISYSDSSDITGTTPVHGPKPECFLLCVTERPDPDDIDWSRFIDRPLPKDLCNIIFYSLDKKSDNIFKNKVPSGHAFTKFQEYGKRIISSNFGIDISIYHAKDTNRRLQEKEGTDAFHRYWAMGFKNFAVLDMELSPRSERKDYGDVKALLSTLKSKVHGKMGIFIGISVLLKSDDSYGKGTDIFNELVSTTDPDGVLLRTTYRDSFSPDKCALCGSSVWANALLPEQPSFEGTLEFMQHVRISPKVMKFLSFTMAGRGSYAKVGDWNLSATCYSSKRSQPSQVACPGGAYTYDINKPGVSKVHSAWMERMAKGADSIHIFEWKETISKKICWAYNVYGFEEGFVVFDFGHDVLNDCASPKSNKGFGSIFQIVDNMTTRRRRCKDVEPPDTWRRNFQHVLK
ncbi:uncharacterized protein LOC135389210 [Ornithodoros turicata]|uniref:uncharacterized protein LOC135389210 n=1 Tax=Ornithodoros turicata TaxID=34597 RepID=UPI003139AB35